MQKRILIAVFCMLLPTLAYAQTGKLAGKVTDRETGEPLIGANVVIDGSDRGAAANINGEYVILNVPIGKVTVVSSYIGYQAVTIRDVLVRSNETTIVNFQLPGDAFRIGEIEIVAQKPLVDKNITNAKATVTQEEIVNLPVRGVESIVALQAGIVQQGGAIYVRGSRGDATGYVVDGIVANDPVYGGRNISVINNAIAEVSFQAGGYSAEFGGASGGLISTTTRSGGRTIQIGFESYTDSWSGVGKENFFGSYNYGTSLYALTAAGPLYGPVRFFVAGQNSFQRTPARYRDPYNLADKYDRLLRETVAHSLLSPTEQEKVGIFDPRLGKDAQKVDFTYPGGFIHNDASEGYVLQGNLTFDWSPVNIRFGGTYGFTSARNGAGILQAYQIGRTAVLENGAYTINDESVSFANQNRALLNQVENYGLNFKLTHLLNASTFYEVFLGYSGYFNLLMDNDHRHDLFAYGDSVANAAYGYPFRADGNGPPPIVMFGQRFHPFGFPEEGYAYQKDRYKSVNGKLNLVHQIGRTHEIKVGGEAALYSIRQYDVVPYSLKSFLRNNPGANPTQQAVNSRTNYIGYDMWGVESDDDLTGPKRPIFAAAYALDKIELEDLVINVGLRWDYIDTDSKQFVDPQNVKFDDNGMILNDPSNIEEADPTSAFSPRLGFSFPVTDQTVFYAQYGKFVQQSRLRDLYVGYTITASNIRGGYAIENPVGFGLKPETTIQYDFGFRQQIGDFLAFDIGAFYKDIRDQIQVRQIVATPGAQHQAYDAWVNGDFATTSGVSLKMDLRRVERVQASIDYTYSDARGTGSSPSTAFRTIWQSPTETPYLPKYTTPLNFDQTHRGAVNIDYRFSANDGPEISGVHPLENLGLNMLFTFNSGHPFTLVDENSYENRRQPVEVLNESRTPWNFQIDARLDKTLNIAGLNVNLYIWVINLLDKRNVQDVFIQTGSASDDGYLSTDQGRQELLTYSAYGKVFEDLYRDFYYQYYIQNADFFGPPRQVRLGLRLDF